ncbi:MAG: restriction endonuclease subunit S [Methylococcaceae bacterium]
MNYVKAKDLVTFKTGKLDSNAAEEGGLYPFFTCAQTTYQINSFAFDTECVLLAGNNASAIFPLKYFNGKFDAYQRTYIIETKQKNQLNIRYFYFFLIPYLKSFEQQATGATTKFLTMKILNNIQVALPEIEVQDKIAEILSAYDDLIETNNQRIATLEQLAQQIYKEWFVRMRFPGWENTAFQHGIPDGWEELPFAGLVDILSGGTPSTNTISYWNGDVLFFTPKDANTNCIYAFDTEKKITDQGLENCNSSLYEPNTVFITARGTVGKVNLNLYSMAMNQSCFALRGKTGISQSYLFFATKSNVDSMKSIANGATFDAITIDSFSRFKALKPTSDLINKFDDILIPFLNEIKCIVEVNINLTRIRDLLLPRLISGKLSIKQAEAFTP